jgi:hypothetical protein
MNVKIYREPENTSLLINEEDLEQYNALALELGLCTQEKKDESKIPNVYTPLNMSMTKQLHALCPRSASVESYTRSTIPLEVLQVYKLAKDNQMFEGFEIWWDDIAPDPLLIGWNFENAEAREKNYTWRRQRSLIARWGDCALEMSELMERGFNKIRLELLDKTNEAIEKCTSIRKDPDRYVRKILTGNSETISIDTVGSSI